ncbi:hypothetical protein LTR28_008377, partial [Elasticomyces elasticus]
LRNFTSHADSPFSCGGSGGGGGSSFPRLPTCGIQGQLRHRQQDHPSRKITVRTGTVETPTYYYNHAMRSTCPNTPIIKRRRRNQVPEYKDQRGLLPAAPAVAPTIFSPKSSSPPPPPTPPLRTLTSLGPSRSKGSLRPVSRLVSRPRLELDRLAMATRATASPVRERKAVSAPPM